ncbi:MAG TPA: SBBP repeat-containing protein [Thermoanaerobaculia bacterium]|nr:SBBP repeat-containing protein [Thermoanaerobaculia bacterium]
MKPSVLRRAVHVACAALLPLASLLVPGPAGAVETSPAEVLGRAPLSFEPNVGQSDPEVRFLARGSGYALFLTRDEAVLALASLAAPAGKPETLKNTRPALRSSVLRMRPAGARPAESLEPEAPLPGRSHYLSATAPGEALTDVPRYARVRARGIYPGVDLVYYGQGKTLEYDFVVAPGADPDRIRLEIEGAESLRLDEEGNLRLRLGGGEILKPAPVLYQEVDGERRPVSGRFLLAGNTVGFEVGAYDRALPLVIDPTVVWASLLGGNDIEWAYDVAVTPNGQAYACGYTYSTNFPTRPAASDPDLEPYVYDAFVTKFNLDGTGIDWSTYVGGPGFQSFAAIALDASRNPHVVGSFDSEVPAEVGTSDAFVGKLNATGSAFLYSRRLRGTSTDYATDVALDASGNAYVVGTTYSTDFPMPGGAQQSFGGGYTEAFVAKLGVNGGTQWASYYGGPLDQYTTGIAVDAAGQPVVSGYVQLNGPSSPSNYDAFVFRMSANGASFQGQVRFGGSLNDYTGGLVVDPNGNTWVTGTTYSGSFQTTDGTTLQGESDVFLVRVNAVWTGLSYSTLIGNVNQQFAGNMAVDYSGWLYIVGSVFPAGGGPSRVWLARFIPTTNGVTTYATGGTGGAFGLGIAVDNSRAVYVSGVTSSSDFATPGAFQTTLRSGSDAFVAKITF